jgi:hypothetical protein
MIRLHLHEDTATMFTQFACFNWWVWNAAFDFRIKLKHNQTPKGEKIDKRTGK